VSATYHHTNNLTEVPSLEHRSSADERMRSTSAAKDTNARERLAVWHRSRHARTAQARAHGVAHLGAHLGEPSTGGGRLEDRAQCVGSTEQLLLPNPRRLAILRNPLRERGSQVAKFGTSF